jgi:hypothetical protein
MIALAASQLSLSHLYVCHNFALSDCGEAISIYGSSDICHSGLDPESIQISSSPYKYQIVRRRFYYLIFLFETAFGLSAKVPASQAQEILFAVYNC